MGSDESWDDEDELPETGHDLHFLSRLERVAYAEADLALRLYRDRPLVRALLDEERSGAERIAIALTEGPEPPHAIVERGGAFVTCLGAGMTIGQCAAIPFARVQIHIGRADLLAERSARAGELWRDRAGVRHLLERCDAAGARLPREDFQQLAILAPILEGRYLDRAMVAFARVKRAAPHVLRLKRFPPSIEPKLLAFWNRFHAVGNYLHLSSVLGKQSFAIWERAEISPRLVDASFDPFRHLYFQQLTLGRGYVALRIFAALGRAGELAVPMVKERMAEAPSIVRWFHAAYALVAIARRHRKLRVELARAVGPARLPLEQRTNESAIGCAKVLQMTTEATWGDPTESDEATTATMRRLAEAIVRDLAGEESLSVQGDELSFARLASFDCNFLRFDQDVAALSMAVALCAEVAPEELYFPAASINLAPAFTPEAAKDYAYFVPKPPEPVRAVAKPERNAPCSCGSGKKYKRCCGTH